MIDELEDYPDPCNWCFDHVPATGYWKCPICDAEWWDYTEEGSEEEETNLD